LVRAASRRGFAASRSSPVESGAAALILGALLGCIAIALSALLHRAGAAPEGTHGAHGHSGARGGELDGHAHAGWL